MLKINVRSLDKGWGLIRLGPDPKVPPICISSFCVKGHGANYLGHKLIGRIGIVCMDQALDWASFVLEEVCYRRLQKGSWGLLGS